VLILCIVGRHMSKQYLQTP